MGKLMIIMNVASHYRQAIYQRIDDNYDCEWFFGPVLAGVKQMDTSRLKNVHMCRRIGSKPYILLGVLKYVFKKDVSAFLMLGEIGFLTPWLVTAFVKIFYRDKKIYYWCHGLYGNESKCKLFLKKIQFVPADIIFTYGEHARALMQKLGFDGNKVVAVHNSLDYELELRLRESIVKSDIYYTHFRNTNPVIIFIGRLTATKRLDLLIEALSILKNRGCDCNLVFVGNGEMAEKLRIQGKEMDLNDQLWFYDECYDERLNSELLYNADVCVSPGNVGLTAMHSMMFGCPVISHNRIELQMPEFEAIIEGQTGAFFEYGNSESLASCIQKWLSQMSNRNRVRQRCYEEIDSYWTPDFQMSVFNKYLDVGVKISK